MARNSPILVDGERDLGDEIASLVVGQERFRALGAKFDRPAELARGPHHQTELDIGAVAGAEIAAHVEGQDAHSAGSTSRTWASSCFWRTAPPLPA